MRLSVPPEPTGPQRRCLCSSASSIEALKDKEPQVRQIAATALGKIGPDAREAIDPLTAATKDPSPQVRGAAALALNKIRRKARDRPRS